MTGDKSSEYEQKYISAFVLYSDGYSYYTEGLITSGIDAGSLDYCDELPTNNTFERARDKFERRLSQSSRKRHDDKHDKGVFTLSRDTIKIQIYETGSETLQLMEYEGVVINDTTFHLFGRKGYTAPKRSQNEKLDDTYHFRAYKSKPDSASYIRDHRDKFPQRS